MRNNKEFILAQLNPESKGNINFHQGNIEASPEIGSYLQRLDGLKICPGTQEALQNTLDFLSAKVAKTVAEVNQYSSQYFIAGPEWCRNNLDIASHAHAKVIIDTYGSTYALPNKNPNANFDALKNGLDMYLIFRDGVAVGTSCMVADSEGLAELGRAASHGKIGNRIIQDLRIIDWLSNKNTASKYHTLFATCRTAPDRNIDESTLMRGGQAVCHMWGEMPNLLVCGFGPLYKKHGALETFAYSVLTREQATIPNQLWLADPEDTAFVSAWIKNYHLQTPSFVGIDNTTPVVNYSYHPHYPPLESGVTTFVHGEVSLTASTQSGNLDNALKELHDVNVPFIQVPVPINCNSLTLQRELKRQDFQIFMFTPGFSNRQPPKIWYGRQNNVSVIPRYWDVDHEGISPFWSPELEAQGKRIAANWKKL